jgi:chemotaxis protein histidine kinase CheA
VSPGIDLVLRPVHTIKGTAGFIPGLEGLKSYCHRVEEVLNDLQAGGPAAGGGRVEGAAQALVEIFNLLDQLRSGARELDLSAGRAALARLDQPAPPQSLRLPRRSAAAASETPAGGTDGVTVEVREGVAWLRVRLLRLHLPSQYQQLVRAMEQVEPGGELAVDLSGVRTISSTAWGEIWQAARTRGMAVVGMGPAVRAAFRAWGLAKHIPAHPDEGSFWRQRGGGAA